MDSVLKLFQHQPSAPKSRNLLLAHIFRATRLRWSFWRPFSSLVLSSRLQILTILLTRFYNKNCLDLSDSKSFTGLFWQGNCAQLVKLRIILQTARRSTRPSPGNRRSNSTCGANLSSRKGTTFQSWCISIGEEQSASDNMFLFSTTQLDPTLNGLKS